MRLVGQEEAVRYGWAEIIEDAEPPAGYKRVGFSLIPYGVMDSCKNMVRTTAGRIAVRGGSQSKLTLASTTQVLAINRYSQDGLALVGFNSAGPSHTVFLYSADLATQVAATAMGWTPASPARPVITELFEKLFICDATVGLSNRQQLVSVNASGTVTAVTANLGGSNEALRPFCVATYNSVLFASGFDTGQLDAPAKLWHSFLGQSPDVAPPNNFDPNAWNIIGAQGEYITAMVPGQNVLLIAKEAELYQLTGYGEALPGFQYAVQQVENSDYLGCKWPGALCYAEGYWYGASEAGPWRYDGSKPPEVLVRHRLRSWPSVISLDKAVVRYDPTRRCILFGFVTGSDTAIRDVWLWDIDAEGWVSDWRLPVGVNDVFAIATSGLAAPNGSPNGLAITDTSATLTSISGTIGTQDITSSTEIWTDSGSGFVKSLVLNPNVLSFTVPSMPANTAISVKARYIKNGIVSPFTSTVTAHTLLSPPTISATATGQTTATVQVTQQSNLSTLNLTRNAGLIKTWTNQPNGTVTLSDTGLSASTTYVYSVTATRSDWPASINTSAAATAQVTTQSSGGGGGGGIATPGSPTFADTSASLSTVSMSFTPGDPTLETEVWCDEGSGMSLVTTLGAGVSGYTIVGLSAGTAVPTKLRHKDGAGNTGSFSLTESGHTLLPAPVITSGGADQGDITVNVKALASGTQITLNRGATFLKNFVGVSKGTTYSYGDFGVSCGNSYVYSAVLINSSWPSSINTSAQGSANLSTLACGPE